MKLELTSKQYRRLLDLVYIGNWILNSTREDDRIKDYDQVESQVFAHCIPQGMPELIEMLDGEIIPSRAFAEGGIHAAIMDYENTMFFEILAEELARRDMENEPTSRGEYEELSERMDEYIAEFELHGTDNLTIDLD